MRKIARAIDYSATSIYLHFDDKDHLIHTLIDEGLEQLYDSLSSAFNSGAVDSLEQLEALCWAFVDFGLQNAQYYEIMFLFDTKAMERYPAEKYRRARRNLKLIAQTLEQGQAEGVIQVDDPVIAASSVWASLHGIVSLVLSRRLDVSIDQKEFLETSIQHVINSVTAERSISLSD